MLKRLHVQGFKSLHDVEVEFAPLTVLFGPNAGGKSNLLEALQVVPRVVMPRTAEDTLLKPIRGLPIECFAFPKGGVAELLGQESAQFSLEIDLQLNEGLQPNRLRYRVTVEIQPRSGGLALVESDLGAFDQSGKLLWRSHVPDPDSFFKPSVYSELFSQLTYSPTYYVDPRVAMRTVAGPAHVDDIGPSGEHLAAFLYRLKNTNEKRFSALVRTLRTIIPSVESVDVDLDERRGTLDVQIIQNGITYSSRIISEGTLRVLALVAIAVNPWPSTLIAFEEPENGVHPRRLELIAQLLASMAIDQGRQVVVTTHSPILCQCILDIQRENPDKVALVIVRLDEGATRCIPFETSGPLFDDPGIMKGLTGRGEDGWFEGLVLGGFVDG